MVMTKNQFQSNGRTYRSFRAAAHQHFYVGVDLGQSNDPTAICVIEHNHEPLSSWKITRDTASLCEERQDVADRYDVRHLERMPLGMPYPAVVAHVAQLLQRPPLCDGATLVIDETGVGRAVGDIFDAAGLQPVRVSITAGAEATQQSTSPERWHIAKGILISTLDARLHTGELRFAAALTEAGAMAEELKDFRRKVGAAGRFAYEARVGKHDDLVLAVAIALWRAARPRESWASESLPF